MSKTQETAGAKGEQSLGAAEVERQRDLRGREAATQQEPNIEQVLDKG